MCPCHRSTKGEPGTVLPLRGFQSSGGVRPQGSKWKSRAPSLWRGTPCCRTSKEGDCDGLRVHERLQEENTFEMVLEAQEEFQEEETGELQGKGRGKYGKDSGCSGWTQVSRTPSPRTPGITQGALLNVMGSLDRGGVGGKWIHVKYGWAALLCTRNCHDIVNRLYFNVK